MSTHSAECNPHNCFEIENPKARTLDECDCRGRTLIRKTSLLRKINPMMRRSSFTNKDIYNPLILSMNERRNVPEIVIGIPRIASQIPNSDRSPLYNVKNPAGASVRTAHAK